MKQITVQIWDEDETHLLKTYTVLAKGFNSAVKIASELYRKDYHSNITLVYKQSFNK